MYMIQKKGDLRRQAVSFEPTGQKTNKSSVMKAAVTSLLQP